MKVIDISKKLEDIVTKHDLLDLANPLKNEFAISKSDDLEKAIFAMKDENRVLKIGILGRVKAGKSSLLNALIFNGKNILPKAATPMTAALTKLEYSTQTEASVEFYTQEDIDDLKVDYHKYNELFEKIKAEQIKILTKRKSKRLWGGKDKVLDEKTKKEIEEKALNIANREMKKNDKLFASYDQYERIKKSNVSLKDLEKFSNIKADDIEKLNEKLYDFVGANGKYMPFTKSVSIKLDNENLKDMEVIDTPGINDPITSREERTKELLKECDVVLIVSPSGQFLSNEDIDLLDRISSKEGIQEVFILASQIDNQLYGSEKEKNAGNLVNTLNSISQNFTNHLRSTISKQKEEYQKKNYSTTVFDKIMKNDVICTSGASYSLLKSFDDKSKWDENLKHICSLLNDNYKDYFDDEDSAKASLELLGNIEKVDNILKEVRLRKDEILEEKIKSFEESKLQNVIKFNQALINTINEDTKRIQSSDIEDVKKQKEELIKIKENSSETLKLTYEDIVEEYIFNIKDILKSKVRSFFDESKKGVKDSESTETESYTVSTSHWWNPFSWGDEETRYKDIHTVKAGMIRDILEDLTEKLEDLISDESKKSIYDLKNSLYNKLLGTLRQTAGDDNIDVILVQRTIRNILNSIDLPDIIYTGTIPKELMKTGTLKNYEAERFLEEAKNYMSTFRTRVRNDINKYLKKLEKSLENQDIGNDIFESYSKDIEKLENDINNKELSLAKNENIMKKLKAIK